MLRVLLVGCGDVALRVAGRLHGRVRMYGLVRRREAAGALRALGIVPIVGDLDAPRSLARLRVAPWAVLHFAPPPAAGDDDPRTAHLLNALDRAQMVPRCIIYISTTGVYGDCGGARIDETRPRRATSARARRRVAAEDRLRRWSRERGVRTCVLRAPGIYSATRLPVERIRQGTPALRPEDDVYTNHIHADDLAAAAVAAMFRGRPQRACNVVDDAEMTMGDWFDRVADAFLLPRPPRVSRAVAARSVSPALLSFMSESRRIGNARLQRELRLRLAWPTPAHLLRALPGTPASP